MTKKTLVKQRDITDCGAACLSSIAAFYSLHLSVAKIRQIAGTDKKGTTLFGMIKAAEQLGFDAKAVRGSIESLPDVPFPAIAHVIINNGMNHYVVLYGVGKKSVSIMDPGTGRMEKIPLAKFSEMWTGVLAFLQPNGNFEIRDETVSTLSRFWFLLRPHKYYLFQALIGALLFTILGLSTSIYIQKIMDFVIPNQNIGLLNLLGTSMVLILVFQVIVNVFKSIYVLKIGQQLDAQLILGYHRHVLKLPQSFFDGMKTGEILSRISDAVKIRIFINEIGIDIIINLLVVLFSFYLMFNYYWKLAVLILLIIPLYSVLFLIMNRLNRKIERKVIEQGAELESQLIETINNISTIKSLGLHETAQLKTEVRFVNLLGSIYRSTINGIFSSNSSMIIANLFTIILLWVGAGYVVDGLLSPGELMSFYALTGYFTGPIGSLIGSNKVYQNAKIAADRLFEIVDLNLDAQNELVELSNSDNLDIIFENVKFRYGSRATIFDDLNLRIEQGKISAIIGSSGGGKSTIASLIKKQYEIEFGKISIGNYDLSTITAQSINQILGYVPQNIELFGGSILENIAPGDFDPDVKRIYSLIDEFGAKFILEYPNGLMTMVGENGVNLSGGQQQLVALLRAIYRDPSILILDEATSALDKQTEYRIQNCLKKRNKSGLTVLSISHKYEIAKEADHVFFLQSGKVFGNGTHDYLLNTLEEYKDHWQ
ncbi:MAG: peptidase domain-containing ABC transporter [Cytophagales bacterium]|nr:peptidase domain-containing ABC transporter [Cytophagales bacterium]